MSEKILFSEKQRFTQWWVWAVLILINAIFIVAVAYQLGTGKPLGDRPVTNSTLLIIAAVVLLITIAIASLQLHTEVRADGIYTRFLPFQRRFRFISAGSIAEAYVRKYKPVSEYGGWGIRLGVFGSGKAYTMSGDDGLQLVFNDGRKLLIGTGKPDQLADAVRQSGIHFRE